MMSILEIKEILVQKFEDEGCGFTDQDIYVTQQDNETTITIADYEHCPIRITEEKDEYFGFVLYVKDDGENEIIGMYDSKRDYPYKEALLNIGYHIANTF